MTHDARLVDLRIDERIETILRRTVVAELRLVDLRIDERIETMGALAMCDSSGGSSIYGSTRGLKPNDRGERATGVRRLVDLRIDERIETLRRLMRGLSSAKARRSTDRRED